MLKSKSIEDKQEILRLGMETDFWGLIVEAIENSNKNIKEKQLSEDMKSLPPDEYKLENELYNAKLKFLDKLKETPQNLINHLEKPDNEEENFDPYAD